MGVKVNQTHTQPFNQTTKGRYLNEFSFFFPQQIVNISFLFHFDEMFLSLPDQKAMEERFFLPFFQSNY